MGKQASLIGSTIIAHNEG
ncbi:hypothetical protein WEU39_08525 [Pediococcus pentosaceus]|nr:hypothetical protein [Latilactobacillus sakei]